MGGDTMKIPDFRVYQVEGIKELENLQSKLAARGLKDPWIRNEAWRYQKVNFQGKYVSMFKSMFRGFKYAAVLMIPVIVYDKMTPAKGHHDDHH